MHAKFKLTLATAVLACSTATMADTVELVFDITPTHSSLSGDVQAQPFEWRVSYDLSQTLVPATAFSYMPGTELTFTHETSSTPYTEQLKQLPEGATAFAFNENSLARMIYLDASSISPDGAAMQTTLGYERGGRGYLPSGEAVPSSYARMLNWSTPFDVGQNDAVKAWSMGSVTNFLASQLGQTFKDGFQERATQADASQSITGDATLRSITVVPEPATWTLMGLGLAGLAAAKRRKNSHHKEAR